MDAVQANALNLFISYRRSDSAGHAGRVHDALRQCFGKDQVFFDVTAIEGGMDFAVAIRQAIDRASVVVVIVGPRWARRPLPDLLAFRTDWVRYEIEYAYSKSKPIVPVLVGGATMPRSVPASLAFLSTIHAIPLRDDNWEDDVERLATRLPVVVTAGVPPPTPVAPRSWRSAAAAIAVAGLLALLAVWQLPRFWTVGQPNAPQPTATEPGSASPPSGPSGAPTPSQFAREPDAPPRRDPATNRPPTNGTIDVDIFNRIGIVSATRFTLTAKGIADPDGDPLRYRWDFGDGSPATTSVPSVTKVFERVRSHEVVLYVNDGKMAEDVAIARTTVTVRSLTGTWLLKLRLDPEARYEVPDTYTVDLVQEGDQLSGRITPAGSSRGTVLTGQVKHPMEVWFGSESAWWNDTSDAYFELAVSDGALMIQMMSHTPGRCSAQVPCLSAMMTRQ